MKTQRTMVDGFSNGYKHETISATSLDGHRTVPWAVTNRRNKFRINQMSRDVPIRSLDSHQKVFLEGTAHSNQDSILHLLDKYNGRGARLSDNLESRSMNTLNTFFKQNVHGSGAIRQIQARITNRQ